MPKTTISIKSDDREEFLAAVKEMQMTCNLYSNGSIDSLYVIDYTEPYHLFYLGCTFTIKTDLKLALKTLER